MQAKDMMTRNFVTMDPFAEVYQAFKCLLESKLDTLLVCDADGRVIGIAGITEMVDLKPGLQLHDIMARNFIHIDINATLEEIATLFIMFEGTREIPVFAEQKLAGVIHRQTVLKALNNQLSLIDR